MVPPTNDPPPKRRKEVIPDIIPARPRMPFTTNTMRGILLAKRKPDDHPQTDSNTITATRAHNDLIWDLLQELQRIDDE